MKRLNAAAMTRQSGFSLIELMIAVTLGLIILAALTTFFVQTSANRQEMERNTRQIENGRYAIDSMREDVSLAGFFSDTAPLVTPSWQANAPCPATVAGYGFAASPGVYTAPLPVFGYANGTGAPGCLAGLLAGSDVMVIRRFNSEPNTVAEAAAGPVAARWYLQNSQCVDDSPDFPFKVGAGNSGLFALRVVACTTAARVWRLREQVYYVRNCSVCPPDAPVDNIPTLWRAELDPSDTSADGDAIMRHSALVEGIEALRFEYGVDTSGDGLPDLWKRCDPTCDNAAEWPNVTSVKVYVLSRNLEESRDYTDTKTYGMGQAGTLGPFNDKYKRHVYTAQIAMPNRSGPREPKLSAAPP